MGRPKLSEPRDCQLNLSLTASELAGVKQRAEALGMRVAHLGRSLLLEKGRAVPTANHGEINAYRLVQRQLARLGNNLNQLVRQFHASGNAPPPSDLVPLLTEVRRLLGQLPE